MRVDGKGSFEGTKEKTEKGERSGDEMNSSLFFLIKEKERVEREEVWVYKPTAVVVLWERP